MKEITILVLTLTFFASSYSQTTCPASIKSNSTPSEPTFVLSNGQNGCNEITWPATILVDGLSYSYVSCSGGNLKYIIDGGQTPPAGFDVTVNYPSGLVCDYDVNGNLTTLSNSDFELKEEQFTVYPNPAKSVTELNVKFLKKDDYQVAIINVLGKTVYHKTYNDKIKAIINIGELSAGLYIMKLSNKEVTVLKKIVIEN